MHYQGVATAIRRYAHEVNVLSVMDLFNKLEQNIIRIKEGSKGRHQI